MRNVFIGSVFKILVMVFVSIKNIFALIVKHGLLWEHFQYKHVAVQFVNKVRFIL